MTEANTNPPPNGAPGGGARLTSLYVRDALGGDAASLEWVIRRFGPALRAQAEYRLDRRLRAQIDPADLVNDVWVRALPSLREFSVEGPRSTPPFLRFLSQILLRQVNNLYRKHLRGKPALVSRDDSLAGLPEPLIESARVISGLVRSEEQTEVERAMRSLGDEDREVLVLRGIEQNSTAEIAVLFGVKANTISVRYRRALERLRRLLPNSVADEFPEPAPD